MKTNTGRFSLLTVITCSLLLVLACSSPFSGDGEVEPPEGTGSFTVRLGSSGTISRSAVPYPPETPEDFAQLKFVVKFVKIGRASCRERV